MRNVIAVISDIHSNFEALTAQRPSIAAKTLPWRDGRRAVP